jgi:hypothetical protein
MIHAAIFRTCDPAERSNLLVSGDRANIARNVPPDGCWRPAPAGCTTAKDVPALGSLPAPPQGTG